MYHRLEVYVLDFENYGIKEISHMICNMNNCCVHVGEYQSTVIPEWTDDHELNKTKCTLDTSRKYFDVTQVGSYVDIPLRDKTDIEKDNERLVQENIKLNNKINRLKAILERELKDV